MYSGLREVQAVRLSKQSKNLEVNFSDGLNKRETLHETFFDTYCHFAATLL